MVNIHFTPNFAATAETTVTEWKNAGTDAADAPARARKALREERRRVPP